jgi:predicted TIM-barrel fold metal-dependent hydrolase
MHFLHRGDNRYFVEEFSRDVETSGHNVQATVAIECRAFYRAKGPEALRCVGETEFFIGMAAICESGKYTPTLGAAGIVPFADFTLRDHVRPVLEAHIEAGHGRVKGIRQPSKWDPDPVVRGTYGPQRPGLYLDPAFRKGLAVATSLGLSFDASVCHAQLPDLIDLARAHPDANIVLIHSGPPTGRGSYAGKEKEVYADWRRAMGELAKSPNVTVKLGGIMASSNFPVEKAGMRYGTLWNMYQRLTAAYSPDEKTAMFAGNARRVYRLT